jgi:arylsulfatase A-like enzyme
VPLIFSWPGVIKENIQANGLVELLDLSATILDFAGLEIPEYFQGNSLRSILEGRESGEHIRDSVRCEYFDAISAHFCGGNGTWATMYRRDQYKLSVYHGLNVGELYDLEADLWEHRNLWDSPEHETLKHKLIFESFDQHVLLTTDVGSRRIAPM